jgi:hypothetical protein
MASRIRFSIASALLTLLLSSLAVAQGGNFVRQVVAGTVANGGTGQVIPNAIVRVCTSVAVGTPCSPLAPQVYSDPALTTTITNPFAADINGFYSFFLPTGVYIVQESTPVGAGFTFSESFEIFVNGTGTVSIVSLTMPTSMFAVTGSPCVNICNLTAAFLNQSAFTVFGNFTGSSAVPTFGLLNADMIPSTLNSTTISGDLTVTGNTTLAGTLGVTGLSTLGSLSVTGSTIVGGTLGVTGLSTFTLTNATTGYQYAGAAPLNHVLVGDGTEYVDAAAIPSSALPTIFYQTIDLNGTPKTQRPTMNLSPLFSAADSASPAQTNVGLNAPGTGTFVATYLSSPSTSTNIAAFDGNGNLVPTVFASPASFNAPQRTTSIVGGTPLTPNTQTIVLTETVTFPSVAGTYRADVRYGAWITASSNACAAEVIDTTNNVAMALSGQDANGSGYIALSAAGISSNTYAAGATATFTLQVMCNAAQTVTANSALFTFSPAEATHLTVTPVLSNP